MARRVTLDDIAAELKISKSQVSRALCKKYGVSNKTRSEIIVKAFEMGYDVSNIRCKTGRMLRTGVIILRSDLADKQFYLKLVYSIEQLLNDEHMDFRLYPIEKDYGKDQILDYLYENYINVILTIGMVSENIIQTLSENGYPVVAIDAPAQGIKVNRLAFNNFAGTFDMTQYMIACGHTRIIFAGNPEYSYNFRERWNGYDTCMRKNGLNPSYTACSRSGNLTPEDIAAIFNKKLAVSAVICANDTIAFGIYLVCQSRGIRIPQDISIAGFDNVDMCVWSDPPLSTVNFNPSLIASTGIKLLSEAIKNPVVTTKCVTLDANLIIRASIADYKLR